MEKNSKGKSPTIATQEKPDATQEKLDEAQEELDATQEKPDAVQQEKPEKNSKSKVQWNKKLSPALGYGVFFGVLAVAVCIGLLVCLL